MKVQILIETDVEDKDVKPRSPLMKLLKAITRDKDAQVEWYDLNRERILEKEKDRRAAYARDQYQKRKAKKQEEEGNVIIMPEFPENNILKFP
jgi:RNA recognition motif-containing protein